MADNNRTSFQEIKDALVRAKRKADEFKAQGEEIAGEAIATAGVMGASAAGGFLDELKGADIGHGIRQHKVGSIPTSFGVGVGLWGASVLGVFGKYNRVGYALAEGGLGNFASTWGRLMGANMREKSVSEATKVETTTTEVVKAKKTGTNG